MNFEVPLATGLTRVEQHPSEGAAARRFNGGWQQDDDHPEVTITGFVLCDFHMGTGEKVFFIPFLNPRGNEGGSTDPSSCATNFPQKWD